MSENQLVTEPIVEKLNKNTRIQFCKFCKYWNSFKYKNRIS